MLESESQSELLSDSVSIAHCDVYEIDVVQYLLGEEYADRTNKRFPEIETTKNDHGDCGNGCELWDGISHSWNRVYAETRLRSWYGYLLACMGWLRLVENSFDWTLHLF